MCAKILLEKNISRENKLNEEKGIERSTCSQHGKRNCGWRYSHMSHCSQCLSFHPILSNSLLLHCKDLPQNPNLSSLVSSLSLSIPPLHHLTYTNKTQYKYQITCLLSEKIYRPKEKKEHSHLNLGSLYWNN